MVSVDAVGMGSTGMGLLEWMDSHTGMRGAVHLLNPVPCHGDTLMVLWKSSWEDPRFWRSSWEEWSSLEMEVSRIIEIGRAHV